MVSFGKRSIEAEGESHKKIKFDVSAEEELKEVNEQVFFYAKQTLMIYFSIVTIVTNE